MSGKLSLNDFENCMLDMIQQVEFKTNTYPNELQKQLRKDMKEIEENNIFVKADKTTITRLHPKAT